MGRDRERDETRMTRICDALYPSQRLRESNEIGTECDRKGDVR